MKNRISLLLPAAALLAAVAALGPAPSSASVGGSAHDLVAQGYDVPKGLEEDGPCFSCHLPVGMEQGEDVRVAAQSLKGYDVATLVCFSCHDGTTLVDPHVDASTTAFHPLSHGYDLEGYRDRIPTDGSLPHTDSRQMSCISCHDPHSGRNRPFLRRDLGELCQNCHEDMVRMGGDATTTGNHPVFEASPEGGREAVPLKAGPDFRVGFPARYPLGGGRTVPEAHWDLGGHLDEGDFGLVGCVTCHAVHGDEDSRPLEKLLARDPGNVTSNEFCEGCHRGERGDGMQSPPYPNPGGTSTARTYHPVDDDESREDVILATNLPPRWPYGTGPQAPLLCTTCHRAHGALPERTLLRATEAEDFCEECHETIPLENHHPITTSRCSENLPLPAYGGAPGKMYCSLCHRAHNAGLGEEDEALFVPLLRVRGKEAEYCETCHPAGNPTCSADPASLASHFIGDPTLSDTYDNPAPPLRREAWPDSGLLSVYEGPAGMTVTCLSCHTFEKGAVVSGDDGTAGHLLALAGNRVEWEEGEERSYLCAGCHSADPETMKAGSSHPYMDADAANLPGEPQPPVTITPNQHVNCDSCHRSHGAVTESGYYILEAVTSENKDPRKIHPKIDFTVLCQKCHEY